MSCFFSVLCRRGQVVLSIVSKKRGCVLGVPFNIASYALLTHMLAQSCGLQVGDFIHTMGDAHIYSNHLEQVHLQLSREFRTLPTLELNPAIKDVLEFKYEDVKLLNYDPHPAIKAPVAI